MASVRVIFMAWVRLGLGFKVRVRVRVMVGIMIKVMLKVKVRFVARIRFGISAGSMVEASLDLRSDSG